MVCISVLFWIVFDHFIITLDLNSEKKLYHPLLTALRAQKRRWNGGGYLKSSEMQKNANRYNAVNSEGNSSEFETAITSVSIFMSIKVVDLGFKGLLILRALENNCICSCLKGVVSIS